MCSVEKRIHMNYGKWKDSKRIMVPVLKNTIVLVVEEILNNINLKY
jgi:hypothetical protein